MAFAAANAVVTAIFGAVARWMVVRQRQLANRQRHRLCGGDYSAPRPAMPMSPLARIIGR